MAPTERAAPLVSVVIPARDAAATLARAIAALRDQTLPDWEAIVVDDGSRDETAAVAAEWAAREPRLRSVGQPHAGAGAARNRGVAEARGDWLLFLDADDWLAGNALELLVSRAREADRPDWVVCGYTTVAPDGRILYQGVGAVPDDLVAELARTCPFTIHCCLVRRSEVVAAGGFDSSLRTCEDWDLWSRLARRGLRAVSIPDSLAYYCRRDDSLSADFAQLLADGLRVILSDGGRGESRWRAAAAATHLFWCGGALAAQGGSVAQTLAGHEPLERTALDPPDLARAFFRGARDGTNQTRADWPRLLAAMADRLPEELAALERFCRATDLALAVRRELERYAVEYATDPWPLRFGATAALEIDAGAEEAVPDLPAGVELLAVRRRGSPVADAVWLAVVDGHLPASASDAWRSLASGAASAPAADEPATEQSERERKTGGWRAIWRRARRAVARSRSAEPVSAGDEPEMGLPILLYHRVAPGSEPSGTRYRVDPRRFEEQLQALSAHGYRSVTLGEWRAAVEAGGALPELPVLLCFDDAYADFAEEAWPRLERYGFGACLAVVSGEIGGRNRWDEGLAESAELLDLETLRALVGRGVEVASHTARHRYLPGLAWPDLLADAVRSRETLEDALGVEVKTLAYPYGAETAPVRQLVAEAGYRIGLTCRARRAAAGDDPLRLPRLEVFGDDDLARFVAKLEA